MFYFAFGKILTLTLEAYVLNIAYQAYAQLFQQFNLTPRGVFNALICKGKPVRFQQRMKGLFANWPFLKSYKSAIANIVYLYTQQPGL